MAIETYSSSEKVKDYIEKITGNDLPELFTNYTNLLAEVVAARGTYADLEERLVYFAGIVTAGLPTLSANKSLFNDGTDLSWREIYPQVEIFTSSGTFTVPASVTKIRVKVWGGGGAGYTSSTTTGGEGGGGGGYCEKAISVTPGEEIAVTVGSGGTVPSGNGSASSFGSHCTANGGSGGTSSDAGAGGEATDGDLNLTGTSGGTGGNYSNCGDGGSAFQSPGSVNSWGTNTPNASLPGSGGCGGVTSYPAGTGASGLAIVMWA